MAVCAIVADAHGQHVELGAGGHGGAGAPLDGGAHLGQDRQADGAGGVQRLEHEADGLGPVGFGNLRDRDGLGRGVPAAVHVPAQHPVGAGGGGVDALGRPGHPVAAVGQREQGEDLAPVVQAVPAERPVASRRRPPGGRRP